MRLIYLANLRLPTEKAYGVNIAETCRALADTGLEVTLVLPYRKNLINKNIFDYYGIKNNFKTKTISAIDVYLPGKLDRISVIVKNFISGVLLSLYAMRVEADIIYSRDEFPLFFLSFFRRSLYFEAHKFSSARLFFYKRFLKRGIKIIIISKNLKSKFINIGFPPDQVLVAHDGVNLRDFDITMSKEDARNKTGLPRDAKIAMYTGHLFDWKGADTLAMAAKTLPDIKFVFVGGTERDINIFKTRFGNVPNIIIIGHKPHQEIPVFLKAADVLILPNSSKNKIYLDTSPIKLFEYMASGRPIITSDLPSIREVLNENNAILFNSDDPLTLSESIHMLANNNALGLTLAEQAKRDVENYTWDKRADSLIKFFLEGF